MNTITTHVEVQSPPENSIQHTVQVSLTSRSPASVVHLVQYDATVPIIAVALTANGQPYTVPSGAAVNVRLAKPDGTYVYNPAYGLSEDRQTVYIAVTVQMTVCIGKLAPVVEVVIDGGMAATGFFILDIDPNPIPEDAIASTDEYKTIQQLAAKVQEAAAIIVENEQAIQDIENNLDAIQGAAGNAQSAAASAALAQQYASSINPANFATAEQGAKADAAATAVAYTITVPSTGWTSGSLVWGGTTYTRQRTVTAAQATANQTTVLMEYAGGDYTSYCAIQLLDTQDGSVVLWAAADPEESCQIKVTEVRAGAST